MPVFASTPAVERAVCRLLGVDGVGPSDVPVPNLFVERLGTRRLEDGAAHWLGAFSSATGRWLDDVAAAVAAGDIDFSVLGNDPLVTRGDTVALNPTLRQVFARLESIREQRAPISLDPGERVRIGSGDLEADRVAAIAAVEGGARAVELIRCEEQRALDWIPYGCAAGGKNGSYVTQANVVRMREAIDAASSRSAAHVSLWIVASGPCLPEFAAIGALERVDVLLLEPGSRSNAVDERFARTICARAGMLLDPEQLAAPYAPGEWRDTAIPRQPNAYWNPFG